MRLTPISNGLACGAGRPSVAGEHEKCHHLKISFLFPSLFPLTTHYNSYCIVLYCGAHDRLLSFPRTICGYKAKFPSLPGSYVIFCRGSIWFGTPAALYPIPLISLVTLSRCPQRAEVKKIPNIGSAGILTRVHRLLGW